MAGGYNPQEQAMQQGYQQAPPAQGGNGMALTGMILGIISLVLCWIIYLAIPLGILGIIFGAVGLGKARKLGGTGAGQAKAGLITGILGIVVSILIVVLVAVVFVSAIGELSDIGEELSNSAAVLEASTDINLLKGELELQQDMNGKMPANLAELGATGSMISGYESGMYTGYTWTGSVNESGKFVGTIKGIPGPGAPAYEVEFKADGTEVLTTSD